MAEAKSEMLPFAADALHTNALAASNDAALIEGGADYYGLRQTILGIGRSCLTPGSRVVDLRCDLETLMPLVQEHEDLCKFVALSPTEEESWVCFDRLRTRVRLGFVDAAHLDLRERFPEVSARMVLALEALSDLSASRRLEVAESVRRRLERSGAAIFMEQVEPEGDGSAQFILDPMNRRKRRAWSAVDWESFFMKAGFSTVTRIWSDGGRMAWMLKR
jgi:hypothetical protein